MKCGDTCRHNISKLISGLSVKLLQLPPQGSGKPLGANLRGACSIFLQKSFVLVRHIYWIFRLLLKQVTTLPWHFTLKGALFGPIYGIYVG